MNNLNKQQIFVDYIPHGIDQTIYTPIINKDDKKYQEFLTDFYDNEYDNYKFILFYNNRNIKRKMTSDVMLAFATFVRSLPEKDRDKVMLLMHTHIVDEAGTNLKAVYDDLFKDVKIMFSTKKYSSEVLNFIYNSVDVTINIANNEGYGLATAESLMSGTPIIATVTGGLQDQMGFKGVLNQEFFNDKKKPTCGKWAYPIYPAARNLMGSPPTPYIFADYINYFDVVEGIKYWYELKLNNPSSINEYGSLGREYLIKEGHTFDSLIDSFDNLLVKISNEWKPRKKVFVEKV